MLSREASRNPAWLNDGITMETRSRTVHYANIYYAAISRETSSVIISNSLFNFVSSTS